MKSTGSHTLLLIFPPLVGYLVYAMSKMSLGVVLPSIQSAFGIFEVQAGVLVSTCMLSIAIAMAFGGYLADRIGVTATFLLGLILLTSGLWFMSAASDFVNLAGFLALAGVGGGIMNPTIYTWLGEYLPTSRGLMLGLGNAVFYVGGMAGPWLTGRLLISYSWDMPFKLFALVSFAALLIYLSLFRAGKFKAKAKPFTLVQGYKKLLKSRNVLLVYCSFFAANFAFISFVTWTPTFLLAIQGLNVAEAGFVVASFSITGAGSCIILGYLSDRLSRKLLVFSLGTASAVLTYLFYSLTPSFPMIILFSSLCGFFICPYWNLLIALAQETVETAMVGTVTGLVQNGAMLGAIPSPIIVGVVIKLVGIPSAMIIGVSLPLLLYSIIILGYTSFRKIFQQ